ncbi:hypothetical protein M408DRAFT_329852 [Serendipita vermifera MAFF 305830]|uniref:Complex 1 LYR protein domain-containing protein n=1 Tax=Serendipita vermifera MAFF 305830 TaxID=933852 RepID=A0A0C2XFT1_SERVB|nr:hypothetical protein M408DRAFT_331499 [Serendipita vermifera MAFF 305830]KIM27947.1 hypothetical protein M408DRAFT_329852 [Serendipita vermifera MAFF 305830]
MSTGLSLKHFILRVKVLHFYRSVIRASRFIPSVDGRKDTIRWVREEIEQSSHLTNTERIEQELSHLQRLMKQALPGFELAAKSKIMPKT